jgi:hypothetical protein
MAERDPSELDLAAAFRVYLEKAPTEVRPTELARHFATVYPQGRTSIGPWRFAAPRLAWLALLAALLAALGGTLLVGSQLQRKLPAVVPPVGQLFECSRGSNPDTRGRVDQARPAEEPSATAFDRRAGRLVVVTNAGDRIETWAFDVCTNTWTRMHPDREPPSGLRSRLVYDVDSDLTIGIHEPTGNVWAYDLEADTWTEHGVAPTFDTGFYDPGSGLVVAGVQEDLWNYDVETDAWTPIPQATRWEGLGFSVYVYDASVDRIVVYGGGEGVADTRLFDLRTGTWSRSAAETPDCTMHAWQYPAIVYDEAARRTVVTGNPNMCAYDASADRWEILYERDPSGALLRPRVYDPVNRRLLVWGSGIGDIVAFDLVTREWTVLLEREEG